MPLSNLEYVPLRLLRRFVFRDSFLLRWGRFIPYYRPNTNQVDPAQLVDSYTRHLALSADLREILEIGVGATNSTGYEIAARSPDARLTLLEPFVSFDAAADRVLLSHVAGRYNVDPTALADRVSRIASLDTLRAGTIDLVLSSSVLEHVSEPPRLFTDLCRVLRPAGRMLHLVDYRDHFFKYPFHFLQFSRAAWDRWLNPGDLPRWRVYDHIEALEQTGFDVELPEMRRDDEGFAAVADRLSSDFRRADPRTGVTFAALLARPRRP